MSSETIDPKQDAAESQDWHTARPPRSRLHGDGVTSNTSADSGEYREGQFQAVFDNSSDLILRIDQSMRIVEANPAAARLFNWKVNNLIGKHCSEVLICRDELGQVLCDTPSCPLVQALAASDTRVVPPGPIHREVTWQTAQGNRIEVSATFAPVATAAGRQAVVIAHDLTPLNNTDHLRSHFISMVSHELRTPINSINGFLEIVLDGHVGPLSERQVEFLNYARSSTQQLMTLVEDILFISRADTGEFKLRFDTVNVPDLVIHTAQNCRTAAEHAGVDLMIKLPEQIPTINADELRLQQVLTNLIHNAIKFTPPEGKITIQVEVWPNDICFDVCDTGEGVALDEQLRIFQRFYQSPNTVAGRSGGYGLGLAIAQLIVQQHGGRIWVTSAPPDGATFSFTIPRSNGPSTGPVTSSPVGEP